MDPWRHNRFAASGRRARLAEARLLAKKCRRVSALELVDQHQALMVAADGKSPHFRRQPGQPGSLALVLDTEPA